jgi:plastocyanin
VACSESLTVVARLPVLVIAWLAMSGPPARIDVQGVSSLAGRPVGETVVWLDLPGPRRETRPVLDQRNLSFSPRVMAVQVGTTVKFPNSDRVFHNVFSTHDSNKFNLGFYPVGAVKEWRFDRAGLSRVFCSIHPQMAAYIMVVDTPYFAVADARGQFVIRNVPPGTYRSLAWRPGSDLIEQSVIVGADTRMVVEWP